MTANTTTSTRRVAAGAVAQHDCADRGCLAAMLGLALSDATANNAPVMNSASRRDHRPRRVGSVPSTPATRRKPASGPAGRVDEQDRL